MIRNKIINNVVGLALSALTLTACSDTWDDHYDATLTNGVSDGTLWQAISSNSELSNFASVVKACGYDVRLNGSQMFSVFAPVNSQFSQADADALITQYNAEKRQGVKDEYNTVIKEFLQNHIALYNYSVAEDIESQPIVMMNGKYQSLGSKQFGGNQLLSSNALYGNGVLFTIDKQVSFFPNVFEYLTKDGDLDSLRSFLYNDLFYRNEFQESQSVSGGLDSEGRTIYLDSVFLQKNELFSILNAKLNDEDSTYWMLAPTNEVWSNLVEEYKQYFAYEPQASDLLSVGNLDSLIYTNTRLAIVEGSIFSRTTNTDKMLADSAMSTSAVLDYNRRANRWGADSLAYYQYMKPLVAPDGVLTGTDDVECSNGVVKKVSEWKIGKTQTFARERIIEIERAVKERGTTTQNGKEVETTLINQKQVTPDNPFYGQVSGNSYVEFTENVTTGNHTITFNIPNVLSNVGYDIYFVMVPAIAGDTLARGRDLAPVKLRFTMGYHDASGKAQKLQTVSSADSDPTKVDWMLVAENFKFPVCTYGLNEAEPQATLTIDTRVSSREYSTAAYQRTLRVDCIVLKPHEE
jgi:uncharacterized surface protein with fasciclin (FAS1) repeats